MQTGAASKHKLDGTRSTRDVKPLGRTVRKTNAVPPHVVVGPCPSPSATNRTDNW